MGQKIDTNSTDETELVDVDDYLPTVLWGKYCVKLQGYTICWEGPNDTVSPLPLDPSNNKTRNNKVPVTNPKQVSWAERVRGNTTIIRQPQELTRHDYLGGIGNYASRLKIL